MERDTKVRGPPGHPMNHMSGYVEDIGIEGLSSGLSMQPGVMGVPSTDQFGMPSPPKEPGHEEKMQLGKRGHDGSLAEGEPEKKKRRRSRKKKDPMAPKRPQTAYLIYYRDNVKRYLQMPQFVNKNGNVDMCKVSKHLGEQWKQLPSEKRKEYHDKYEKQKQKYEEELVHYNYRKKFEMSNQEKDDRQTQEIPPQPHFQVQDPSTLSFEQILNDWKALKLEKDHMIARLNFLRTSFEKFRGNFKNLSSDLNYLLEYLK